MGYGASCAGWAKALTTLVTFDHFRGHFVRDLRLHQVGRAADTANEIATECTKPWAFDVGGIPPFRLGGRPRAR
jgi:hypothetical protein